MSPAIRWVVYLYDGDDGDLFGNHTLESRGSFLALKSDTPIDVLAAFERERLRNLPGGDYRLFPSEPCDMAYLDVTIQTKAVIA